MSSKLILIILSYTISKLACFSETQVSIHCEDTVTGSVPQGYVQQWSSRCTQLPTDDITVLTSVPASYLQQIANIQPGIAQCIHLNTCTPSASYLHSWCSGQLSLPSLRGR